jgi:hypothetical protein
MDFEQAVEAHAMGLFLVPAGPDSLRYPVWVIDAFGIPPQIAADFPEY